MVFTAHIIFQNLEYANVKNFSECLLEAKLKNQVSVNTWLGCFAILKDSVNNLNQLEFYAVLYCQ